MPEISIEHLPGGMARISFVVAEDQADGVVRAISDHLLFPDSGPRDLGPNEAIKVLRQTCRISRNDLAQRLGITPRQLLNLENGKLAVSKEMAERLGKVFHILPSAFM